jgi:hypothetical protein
MMMMMIKELHCVFSVPKIGIFNSRAMWCYFIETKGWRALGGNFPTSETKITISLQ